MKANLIAALETLRDEETFIVKRKPVFHIKKGERVFLEGYWLIWNSGRFERKLSHISYHWPDNETLYYATVNAMYFLVLEGE